MSPLLAPVAERAHGFHQPPAFAGGPRLAGGAAARGEAVSFQAAGEAPSPRLWEPHLPNHSPELPPRGAGSSEEGQPVRAAGRGCAEQPAEHRPAPRLASVAAAGPGAGAKVPRRRCRADHKAG